MKRETKPTHTRVTRSQAAALKEAKAADTDEDENLTQKHDLGFILNEKARKEAAQAKVELSKEEKKRGRMCKAPDCTNYIVHKGLCCRHGGGKKCSMEGCSSSAKHKGRCWKHGGSTECKIDGCKKRAKAKGLCWAHGGGPICSDESCSKVAVSGGLCWAHGGGKRCIYDDCNKPSYERTHNFCAKHYDEVRRANYFEV